VGFQQTRADAAAGSGDWNMSFSFSFFFPFLFLLFFFLSGPRRDIRLEAFPFSSSFPFFFPFCHSAKRDRPCSEQPKIGSSGEQPVPKCPFFSFFFFPPSPTVLFCGGCPSGAEMKRSMVGSCLIHFSLFKDPPDRIHREA